MEPGVPFALLGAVQLLAIAAAVGLAAAAVLRRSLAGVVVALGGVGLAGVEIATALRLGDTGSDALALVRGTASLVLAAGLVAGGLGPRQVPTSMYGVVVPLAAAGGPASFAGAASLLAALGSARARRDATGVTVAVGLGLWGVASFVATQADSGSGAPLTVLLLRGAGALSVLLGLGLLARSSLLSKVVGAILAGVIAMAVAAVGVVGNVVVTSYEDQAKQTVQDAGDARKVALLDLQDAIVVRTAGLLGSVCDLQPTRCREALLSKDARTQFAPANAHDFLAKVPCGAAAATLIGERSSGITAASLLSLKGLPSVRLLCTGSAADRPPGAIGTTLRLTGKKTTVAVAGVIGQYVQGNPTAQPTYAWVYGSVLDNEYASSAVDVGGYGLFFLAGDPLSVVSSNQSKADNDEIAAIAARAGIAQGVPEQGRTVGSQGTAPTVSFRALTDFTGKTLGFFAVSRDAGPALKAERDALRLLVITALLAMVAVALAAVVLGRRTVEPVRQLTAAAERIAAGDLDVKTGVRTRDEVGTLAARFDAMTGSLGQLTGDLRDSAARLETVLASMSDGLLATDGEGVVTSVNRAALLMLGLDAVDVLGEPLSVVADVRDINDNQLADPSMRLRDEPAMVHCADGSTVPVRVALAPLQGVDGVVMVLRDTTREREVERMKTEFLSNVSHELRTPLTPIRGYAEILVSKPGLDGDKVTTFATTIRDEALKMNRVVDLLVDVAALEAGRVSITPRTISPRELLDVRLDAWQGRAPDRKADFKKRVAAKLPALHVDPTWVGKALDELIDNAVKYTKKGTPITLVAAMAPDGHHVRVTVKDAGAGISEDDQAGLFTSFEQVDGSATRKIGGLGLGLSFVRRLAEDAGFPLTVASKVGKGSEFSLDLPVTDEPAPTPRGSRAARR